VLKEAGLVVGQPAGARRLYHLNPGGLDELRAYLDRFWDQALAAFAVAAEHETGERK